MSDYLLLLLIVASIGIGWWLGQRDQRKKMRLKNSSTGSSIDLTTRESSKPNFYITGLNYLLNEQPDQAIDTFIDSMDVNEETVETHLALGNLLRRRGEIDRAIRVHQNLLACSTLPEQHLLYVRLDLARDYMAAGLLDRAERLLAELVKVDGDAKWSGLDLLVDIYQQEKEWQKAITIAEQLSIRAGYKIHKALAHYYCEMASEALLKGHYTLARQNLIQAYKQDKDCVRVSLLLGELDIQLGNYKGAIRVLKRIRLQDPTFIPDSLEQLSYCFNQIDNNRGYLQYLQKCLDEHPLISLILELADNKSQQFSDFNAAEFIVSHLQKRPSVRGLNRLIKLQMNQDQGHNHDNLIVLRDLTDELMKTKPIYRCEHCGFIGNSLHWLCPSCKSWGSVKPIQGLEGE